jgi:hypothetical protein
MSNTSCCISIGRIGFQAISKNRAMIMMIATGFSVLTFILSLVAVIGASTDSDTVENTNWTYAESGGVKSYIGLTTVVVDVNGATSSYKWSDASCVDSYCNDCKDACNSALGTAIINLITCLPSITLDLQRSSEKSDMNSVKFMSIFTGIVGTISTLTALSSYADGCYNNLPSSVDLHLGPGFCCLLVATLLKPVDVVLHLLLPVPAKEDQSIVDKGTIV